MSKIDSLVASRIARGAGAMARYALLHSADLPKIVPKEIIPLFT